MIHGYIIETQQGVYGPFVSDEKFTATQKIDKWLAKNFNKVGNPVHIKPLLDPEKLPR